MHLRAFSVLLLICQACAADWQESLNVAELFDDAGVEGTFVLLKISDRRLAGYNRSRAETRYVPASTFKIPHTLIGISVDAVEDVDAVLPYGGQPQPFDDWERDMSLREAISVSNVPIFQELAERIGHERMADRLGTLDYGNNEIGPSVEAFWLNGPLEISAIEQARFVARLARGELPFSEEDQATVREIVLLEEVEDRRLYGKTGWQNAPHPGIGWWVGWVERQGDVYAFALNLDIRDASDADKRVELGKASLKLLGVW